MYCVGTTTSSFFESKRKFKTNQHQLVAYTQNDRRGKTTIRQVNLSVNINK